MRDDIALLEEYEKSPPSFSVHLYPGHWTLNNGPKFLYNNQVSSILEDIRSFRIPVDFIQIFDDAGIQYYKGCLIVELIDFRPAKAKDPILENPDVQRVVLRPNAETLWSDICSLNAKSGSTWTDAEALEVESKILLSTSPPLCLDPNPQLTRIVNSILRVSSPNVPKSLKRKAAAMVDLEENETEKARRTKILQFMDPRLNSNRKPISQNYKILSFIEQRRAAGQQKSNPPTSHPENIPLGLHRNLMASYSNGGNSSQASSNPTTHYPQTNTNVTILQQPNPSAIPAVPIPPSLQTIANPAQRASPAKMQRQSTEPAPQQAPPRPPSQPVAAVQAPKPTVPQPVQPQQPQQAASTFTPTIPPVNFLHQPPSGKRRMSGAPKPGTPVALSPSHPVQQLVNQPQRQPTPQTVPQPQLQPQSQIHPQAIPQPQVQPPPTHTQLQVPVPPQIQGQQPNHPLYSQYPGQAVYYQQAALARHLPANAAVRNAQQIQQLQNAHSGRSTPAVAVSNANSSPAASQATLTRSPMVANAAAVISGRNTPVANAATPQAVARASPLAVSQPMVQRPPTAQAQHALQQQQQTVSQTVQNQPQLQSQPQGQVQPQPHPMQLTQQQLQALYQQYVHNPGSLDANQIHQLRLQQQQFLLRRQQQIQMAQSAQNQAQQHSGTAQVQQAQQQTHPAQGQQQFGTTLVQQTYANFNPHMYNYMQQQQAAWIQQQQRARMQGQMVQMPNGQQQMVIPQGMTPAQMQGLGRNIQDLQNR